ncbi:hypothetical protein [Paenibacillus endoradicis]|uniref:hypothetical protein n=1 Tax=Paenibacillus endoradicis TaxID=2972487 RepID=UPI002158FF00|nr:hypothetical protein [Paenibacillus endoradicis]MCR8656708.1 hypothetical protein [Paenibacillus endoradicis]
MKKQYSLAIILSHILIIVGCSRQTEIDEIALSTSLSEEVMLEEDHPIKVVDEQAPESTSLLEGSIEDEILKVSIHAEIEADLLNYKTEIIFINKIKQSIDLIADCGSFISNDNFANSEDSCLAVDSMLLKKSIKESRTIHLPKDYFNNKEITVRYRQEKIVKELIVQMKNVDKL